MLDLEPIRRRAEKATEGPWEWFGNTDVQEIHLATTYGGRIFIMRFERWGFQNAAPFFRDHKRGIMQHAKDLVSFEVNPNIVGHEKAKSEPSVYRKDIKTVNHPDAQFIAHSRQDIPALIQEVERLRTLITHAGAEIDKACDLINTPEDYDFEEGGKGVDLLYELSERLGKEQQC